MRRIELTLTEKAYRLLRNELRLKAMTGEAYGPSADLLVGLVKRLAAGDEAWNIKLREEHEEDS
jgi:hypothetical protein